MYYSIYAFFDGISTAIFGSSLPQLYVIVHRRSRNASQLLSASSQRLKNIISERVKVAGGSQVFRTLCETQREASQYSFLFA